MCIICDGGSRDDVLFALHAQVLDRGWAVVPVGGTGPADVGWTYTIGLAAFDHPELVIVGGTLEASVVMLDHLGDLVREGQRFGPGDRLSDDAGENGDITFDMVDPVHVAGGLVACWFEYYGSLGEPMPSFEVVQAIGPSGVGCCPAHRQPVPRLADPRARLDGGRVGPPRPNRAQRRARDRRRR